MLRPFTHISKPLLNQADGNLMSPNKNLYSNSALAKAVEFIQEKGLDNFHTLGKSKLSSSEYTESCLQLNSFTPEKKLDLDRLTWNSSNDRTLLDAFYDYNGSLLKMQQQVFPGVTIMFIISRLKALGNRLHAFSGDERKSLRAAIAAHGRDWNKAAEFVATKDSLHCQAQATLYDTPYIDLRKKRPPFSLSDLKRLNDIVEIHGISDWGLIAKKFGDSRKPKFLKFYYNQGLSTLNRQPWTKEEDQYIINSMFQEKIPTWSQLSARLGGIRSPYLIRARWAQINPAVRTDEWADEEKTLLNSLVKKHGISWHNIAKIMKSRTSEECHRQWFKMNYPTLNSSVTVRKK